MLGHTSALELSAMEVRNVDGRGRGLVATRSIQGGEIVLQESPLLIYSEAEAARTGLFCAHCTRIFSTFSSCPRCNLARFCGSDCHSAAEKSSHAPWVCSSLLSLIQLGLAPEPETQARFLIAAVELGMRNPGGFQQLLSLDGNAGDVGDEAGVAGIVEGILRKSLAQASKGLSVEMMLTLLGRDKKNAFGLMAPTSEDGERRVRAYALYPQASMLNHDCLPNACRFEYLDRPGDSNTDIYVRVLHDVSQGSEICISYFPVNWNYSERQRRLLEEYGFQCSCERCRVEEKWSDGEAMEQDRSEGEEEEEDDGSCERQMDKDDEDFPHAMFFVKYVCPAESCGGTMAPLPGDSSTMECNVCGRLRTEEDFVRDLEENNMIS